MLYSISKRKQLDTSGPTTLTTNETFDDLSATIPATHDPWLTLAITCAGRGNGGSQLCSSAERQSQPARLSKSGGRPAVGTQRPRNNPPGDRCNGG